MILWLSIRVLRNDRVVTWMIVRACVSAGVGLLLLSPHAYFLEEHSCGQSSDYERHIPKCSVTTS